jgi:hypothetical protein
MTEDEDRARLDPSQAVLSWEDYWQEALDETKARQPSFDESEYYCSGRASKAWPNKEGPDWWAENGPKFVKSWARWLDASGLEIWEWPDDEGTLVPGIEYEVMAERHFEPEKDWIGDSTYVMQTPPSLYVKSIIDRILWDSTNGDLYLVDLKSGSQTPAWPRQMALNNLGFKQSVATPTERGAQWAGFWSARKGGLGGDWTDLSRFSDEWMWDQVAKAHAMREQHLFIAQPSNLCASACGVKQFCRAMGGDPSFYEHDATLAQRKDDETK